MHVYVHVQALNIKALQTKTGKLIKIISTPDGYIVIRTVQQSWEELVNVTHRTIQLYVYKCSSD